MTTSPDALTPHTKAPLHTVGAVIVRDGKVLLLEHKTYGTVLPGGKVEPGETNEEAVTREVWEEVHLRVKAVRHLLGIDCGPGYVRRLYWAEVEPGEPALHLDPAVRDVRWGHPEELQNGRFSQDRPLAAVALLLTAMEARIAALEALLARTDPPR